MFEGTRGTMGRWASRIQRARWGSGRGPPKKGVRYVLGGSYGSLWAHRLLLDTDVKLDAVLLDSIVPVGASLERVEETADRAVAQLLDSCEEIEACAALFETSPRTASQEAIELYANGEGCGQDDGVAREGVQAMARLHLDGPPDSWIKIVALYESLVRCDEDDKKILARLLTPAKDETSKTPTSMSTYHYNMLLNRHLLYRELYRFDENADERASFEGSALALRADRQGIRDEAVVFGREYRVVEEPFRASSHVPTTLLSGRLDPLDRPEWAVQFSETLEEGTLVSLPWAGHSTLRYLGWQEGGCGREVFTSFLTGDGAERPCLKEQDVPDLGRTKTATQKMITEWYAAQ